MEMHMAQEQFRLQIYRRSMVEEVVGLSRSQLYLLIKQGLFPRPVKVSARAVGWLRHEVEEWIRARREEWSDKRICALVERLHASRDQRTSEAIGGSF